jgi:hypothetical protein
MKRYLTLLLLMVYGLSFAQTDKELSNVITQQDSLFWAAYNNCDTVKMGSFFTEDVEFYHDKGGVTLGLPALLRTFNKNICSNSDFRLKREAVEGSYKVFPMKQNNVVYGAILSGEHVFYILEPGKGERVDGLAKFTHLWLLQNGVWKMKRVLSYDHGPAPYKNKRKEITLSADILSQYAGKYKGKQTGDVQILVENNLLLMKIGEKTFRLYPEKENIFFDKDRDLTFEFVKGVKMTVRENGKVAEELTFVN